MLKLHGSSVYRKNFETMTMDWHERHRKNHPSFVANKFAD
jgi:hypothetical protein